MAAAPELRVIAHLDLDCFYAQVEICRLAIHPTQPVAVQQWDSLIAGTSAAHVATASARVLTEYTGAQ